LPNFVTSSASRPRASDLGSAGDSAASQTFCATIYCRAEAPFARLKIPGRNVDLDEFDAARFQCGRDICGGHVVRIEQFIQKIS
jgi:hypothetical protein